MGAVVTPSKPPPVVATSSHRASDVVPAERAYAISSKRDPSSRAAILQLRHEKMAQSGVEVAILKEKGVRGPGATEIDNYFCYKPDSGAKCKRGSRKQESTE